MQKKYIVPDLKVAGEASNVVLGGDMVGADLFGEDLWDSQQYASDTDALTEAR